MTRLAALLGTGRPLVMGILNVTPDSFSDGGRFLQVRAALSHAEDMIAAGADIIDVGGESTRPGAAAVGSQEELERVLPIIVALRAKHPHVAISVDTSKAMVMAAVAAEDVDLINDVRALQNPGALACLAQYDLPVCLMHMQGNPENMQQAPVYRDVVKDVASFFDARIKACAEAGIASDRLILDVGFGFGKTAAHNLTLINRLSRYKSFGLPLLVGLSRKSTIGAIVEDRLIGSVSGALAAWRNGANILRVHDVAETVAALRIWQSIESEQPLS